MIPVHTDPSILFGTEGGEDTINTFRIYLLKTRNNNSICSSRWHSMCSETDASLTAGHIFMFSSSEQSWKESTALPTVIIPMPVFQMRKLSLSNWFKVIQVVSDKVQEIWHESACFDFLQHVFPEWLLLWRHHTTHFPLKRQVSIVMDS